MKTLKLSLLFISCLLVVNFARAEEDPVGLEQKVTADLRSLLSKFLEEDQFHIQTNISSSKRMERQLVEGESLVQETARAQIAVPPLPGFTPKIEPTNNNPSQTRQTFRMQEVIEIRAVAVQLSLDDRLTDDQANQASTFVRSYLSSRWANKSSLQVNRIRMRSQSGFAAKLPFTSDNLLFWLLCALGVAALFWFWKTRQNQARTLYPSIYRPETQDAEAQSVERTETDAKWKGDLPTTPRIPMAFNDQRALPDPTGATKGKETKALAQFPPLPATENFIDKRTELLDSFLKEASVFRAYYQKLSDGAKAELYAGLRGPAFDNLLESLDLVAPAGADTGHAPSEEQLQFYAKNFAEFIHSQRWRDEQFFGFLQNLSSEQVLSIMKNKNPLVSAVMIKYMRPDQSALVLGGLAADYRMEVIAQLGRTQEIVSQELYSIEQSIRKEVESLPSFIFGNHKTDVHFWTKVLAMSEEQDGILMDLERAYPELYPALAKYRFKLEDIPSLPKPLVQKIFDDVENDELAMALYTCPKDIVDYTLSELPQARRNLIQQQLMMFQGMPTTKTGSARQQLTKRFREVMA